MNSRIAAIRKDNNLSQQEFANRLGLSKNFISLLETGNREPSDRTVADICREFKVNEEWLIHGTGEKYADISREESIAALVDSFLSASPDSFKSRFVSMLSRLTEEQWDVLAKMFDTEKDK